jgi:hypothetical protein
VSLLMLMLALYSEDIDKSATKSVVSVMVVGSVCVVLLALLSTDTPLMRKIKNGARQVWHAVTHPREIVGSFRAARAYMIVKFRSAQERCPCCTRTVQVGPLDIAMPDSTVNPIEAAAANDWAEVTIEGAS